MIQPVLKSMTFQSVAVDLVAVLGVLVRVQTVSTWVDLIRPDGCDRLHRRSLHEYIKSNPRDLERKQNPY